MKKNILIVVDNLIMGGVTKVLSNLLNSLDYEKYNIDLMVLHYYEDMKIELPKNLNIIKGSKFFNVVDQNIQTLIKKKDIKKIIQKSFFAFSIKTGLIKFFIKNNRKKYMKKKYDIEIAYNDGFCHIYTAYGESNFKIAWLHSDVKIMNYSKRHYKTLKKAFMNIDKFVAISEEVCNSYKELYNISNCDIIHNVINDKEIIDKSESKLDLAYDNNCFNMISVGRLDYSKNYEMLIHIHKKLIDDGYKIKTYIVGDGTEKEKLNSLISELHVQQSFILLGRKDNPYPYVKNADLFILSSRYEGLPTVVLEALVLHIPCISTKVAGVATFLKKEYGKIVDNNEECLYNGIKEILDNENLLKEYTRNLENYKYNNEEIIQKINRLFQEEKRFTC